jgi:hypothetical protein
MISETLRNLSFLELVDCSLEQIQNFALFHKYFDMDMIIQLNPEVGGNAFLQNVGDHLPDYKIHNPEDHNMKLF